MLTPFLFFAKFAVFSRFMPVFAGSMADICQIFYALCFLELRHVIFWQIRCFWRNSYNFIALHFFSFHQESKTLHIIKKNLDLCSIVGVIILKYY